MLQRKMKPWSTRRLATLLKDYLTDPPFAEVKLRKDHLEVELPNNGGKFIITIRVRSLSTGLGIDMRDQVTMKLNQRTVMEALQTYLDTHITPSMKLVKLEPQQEYDVTQQVSVYLATLEEIKPHEITVAEMPLSQNQGEKEKEERS